MKLFKGGKNLANAGAAFIGDQDIVIAIVGRVGIEGKRAFIDGVGRDNRNEPFASSSHIHFVITRRDSRNIYLAYTTGPKEQQLTEAVRQMRNWISNACGNGRKFSGLIYLEDPSTPPPTKLSRNALDLLDQCVERLNIIVATTGWTDNATTTLLERRHKELLEQWKPFVARGVSVLRLSAQENSSHHDFHTSTVILNLIIKKAENVTTAKRAVWKGKEQKAEDPFMNDPRDTDLVIPVMGPTGAGKSTFINVVAGRDATEVSHGIKSCTPQLLPVILHHPTDHARRIVLVDTPGFDDTHLSDSEVLRRTAVWLAQSYSANMTLAGVIYLHDISRPRLLGSFQKNLEMFNKLVGRDAIRNVVIATTHWGVILKEVDHRANHEEKLSESHWKDMIDLGAQLVRFADSKESGWDILNHIVNHADVIGSVKIQEELVEIKKILPETEAGLALLYTLEELLQYKRTNVERLSEEEIDKQIRAILRQINELSGNRLRAWWNYYFL
ncbi:hypothetical protein DXG01_008515 [Tephrocybe rancida]|nr:hypothetical protein DXG01_008515 [Tephrocybe rancida]